MCTSGTSGMCDLMHTYKKNNMLFKVIVLIYKSTTQTIVEIIK